MHQRLIAILTLLCFALAGAGCESLFPTSERKPSTKKKKRERKEYETVLMPMQTGSTLQRRILVEKKADDDDDDEPKPKKKAKEKESPTPTPKPKPDAEAAATPAPPEEATPEPTPERFR